MTDNELKEHCLQEAGIELGRHSYNELNVIKDALRRYHNAKLKLLGTVDVSGSLPRTEAEIRSASNAIYNNKNLTYSYREDVIAVLDWVLGGEPFYGLDEQ